MQLSYLKIKTDSNLNGHHEKMWPDETLLETKVPWWPCNVHMSTISLYHKALLDSHFLTILQQTTLNIFCQNIENLYNWMDNLWLKVENIMAKGEFAVFVQFFFCHYVFRKTSAAEASEIVYMRERVQKDYEIYIYIYAKTVHEPYSNWKTSLLESIKIM